MTLAHAFRLLEMLLAGRTVTLAEGVTLETEPNYLDVQFQRNSAGMITLVFAGAFPILERKDVMLGRERAAMRRVDFSGERGVAYLSTGETLTFSLV